MNPTDRIPVTLEARQWEVVLQLLDSTGPHRVVRPLFDDIQRQCMATQELAIAEPAALNKGNGAMAPAETAS